MGAARFVPAELVDEALPDTVLLLSSFLSHMVLASLNNWYYPNTYYLILPLVHSHLGGELQGRLLFLEGQSQLRQQGEGRSQEDL